MAFLWESYNFSPGQPRAGRLLRAMCANLETMGHRLSVSGVRKVLAAAERRKEAA